ncbi:Serine/threonine phosphatase, PP2C-family [Desulfonema limicola]|uniref:Serine/threonine phosphatase, PP2C-family n=1 Tax=Desulfonema limicola TaxID=45656 RepID=A0A975B6M9_9BACT|nr:protein phosphatase 2C domain-containing protein [Desulfonema limicola]QTA79746.1 Serine/threonine phosphatase, PP2C-family [Desulfonema limicola]
MKTFGISDTGLVRKKNEDRYLIKKTSKGGLLLAVADGLGGETAGDFAAEITRDSLAVMNPKPKDIEHQLSCLITQADRDIWDHVADHCSLEGMGTTITGVLIYDKTAHWVHVGDSRLYLLRNNKLGVITIDQNMAQFLVEEGEISEDEVRTHPSRNQLDQCVGCGTCEPETGNFKIKKGDQLILSTDGLHDEISGSLLSQIVTSESDIETKARKLIKAALKAGGRDNITVVIAEI